MLYAKSKLMTLLPIYSAFFPESDFEGRYRIWRFKDDEPSFLKGKVVAISYLNGETILYDYSSLLQTKVTTDNFKDFHNKFIIKEYVLENVSFGSQKIREILDNNALCCNKAIKLEGLIQRYKDIDQNFFTVVPSV